MKWKCWFFHNWGNWKDISGGKLYLDIPEEVIGTYIIQEKRCLDCNKVKIKMIET